VRYAAGLVLYACTLSAQVPAKIDFGRDVQPIFKTYCIGCHGPSQQQHGLRLDRRRDAMRGGTIPVIGPGNGVASRLYLRLIGSQYGLQMPPTGALSPEQINIIKGWIDQGAEWPDELSGETPASPPDPKAVRIMQAIRDGERQAFQKQLTDEPKVANLKGPGGSTPLMYAALYADADALRRLLASGADPNIRNEAGATALMWAVDDLEKTQLLVEHGADVNASSNDGRTPLLIATIRAGSTDVVKLLLDHGADPSRSATSNNGNRTPLSEAASTGDEALLRILIERGADFKSAGLLPLHYAAAVGCANCFKLLLDAAGQNALNPGMFAVAPTTGDASWVKTLLDRGANANARGREDRTILMLAASSDALPLETVKSLIARGADVNARSASGETALDYARLRGKTPVVDLLIQAGAKETSVSVEPVARPKPAVSLRSAVERSLPLLQQADVTFIRKSGCVSCHNDSLTAMTVAMARKNRIPVNEDIAHRQLRTIVTYIDGWRERALQGIGIPGDSDTVSYILLGMAAENYPGDPATDALAIYLKRLQLPDGRWFIRAHRPPLESSDIENTAACMRAMQINGPKARRAEYEKAVQLAAAWLSEARPTTTEERAFQLLGLAWAGGNRDIVRKAARELLAEQRADGGWAQLPSLASDAYATGQALAALNQSRALPVADRAYQRGTQFLRNTQLEDGSWYVKSRALAIMPFFESDFPHGHDQWISAAATNWATMAVAPAAR